MSDTSPRSDRLKARVARGFVDRDAADIAATQKMLDTIRKTYELYGFDALETPFVEYTDALGKFLPDLDRPNEGVFSFQDDDEQWLSLRYDLTAPLARHVAENFDALPKPYRSYRAGYVFRNEKPGPGRFRQFMQFDADTVGAAGVAADAEMCMMAADTLEALGIARGNYVIKVNNRKVLDGVMEVIGLGGEANAGRRLTVLRAIDKLDRLGLEGVLLLLGPGRRDESGDFTKGAGLLEGEAERVLAYVTASVEDPTPVPAAYQPLPGQALMDSGLAEADARFVVVDNQRTIERMRPLVSQSPAGRAGLEELARVAWLCKEARYGADRVRIDPSVVRGLEYYTGPVYEAELTFGLAGEDGRPIRFGSVGGGGRYDGLVGRFRGEPVPATGFSIGVSRLLAALKAVRSPLVAGSAEPGPVVVLVMDRERIADYMQMVATLRNAGIRAEMYLGSSGMKPQLKYADRRGSPCVVIQGSDEQARGEVRIKDLRLGAELAALGKDRDDYLQKQAGAQFAVKTLDLVEAVRKVLARHED